MRFVMIGALAFCATASRAADDVVTASGKLDGKKVQFPAKGLAEGARATIAMLESCHSASDETLPYTDADLKAAKEGDHVRLVFAKPVTVTVLDKKLEVSELVLTQPLNTGAFFLRCGDKVIRCSKFEHEKTKPVIAWREQARPAE